MLLDMAGFNDTGRSHAEVLIVSYMLKRCLEQGSQIKFMLVIDHSTMALNIIDQLVSNFVNLVQMFNL